jgi:hypothetical protein
VTENRAPLIPARKSDRIAQAGENHRHHGLWWMTPPYVLRDEGNGNSTLNARARRRLGNPNDFHFLAIPC